MKVHYILVMLDLYKIIRTRNQFFKTDLDTGLSRDTDPDLGLTSITDQDLGLTSNTNPDLGLTSNTDPEPCK